MRIVPIACLKDNYAYLVICEATNSAAVVDPSEAPPVLAAIEREQVKLAAIWNTHHHHDHVGGNQGVLDAHPGIEVVAHGSDKGRIPGQTRFASEGDQVSVGQQVRAELIHNPGHTSGAISYYLADQPAVFTGDTLFCAGCGRLFEGTPAQMHASLTKLASLPADTRVYCGHEYTQNNLKFAAAVEPDNRDVARWTERVTQQRADGHPTMGSTIGEEKAANPFLRASVPSVIAAARANEPPADDSPTEVFASIRRWKDRF